MERFEATDLSNNSPKLTQDLVWHGTQEKYQIFDHLGGRFNSEFGMEAFPHLQTIKEFVTDDNELYPQSHTLDFHNKGKLIAVRPRGNYY